MRINTPHRQRWHPSMRANTCKRLRHFEVDWRFDERTEKTNRLNEDWWSSHLFLACLAASQSGQESLSWARSSRTPRSEDHHGIPRPNAMCSLLCVHLRASVVIFEQNRSEFSSSSINGRELLSSAGDPFLPMFRHGLGRRDQNQHVSIEEQRSRRDSILLGMIFSSILDTRRLLNTSLWRWKQWIWTRSATIKLSLIWYWHDSLVPRLFSKINFFVL